ncbi:MAG TPA: DUF4190 domain-containing protein [Bacillales bacterium]|nr:DUF4190 domain-containing protein [Bacillales bacterium]
MDDYRNYDEHVNDRSDYLEETATETTPVARGWGVTENDTEIDKDNRGEQGNRGTQAGVNYGTGYGILALILSVLAFFFLPIVMGGAGIVIGFIARAKGANTWGAWAIGVGIAAIVISLFAAPFV